MAIRSTTSQFQPIPPNYTTKAGPFRGKASYGRVYTAPASRTPVAANMSTAPVSGTSTSQYFYAPGLNG